MIQFNKFSVWVALFTLAYSHILLAKEIEVNRMYCYSGTMTAVSDAKDATVFGWEQMGINRDLSDQQLPDQSLHCLGTTLVMGGETKTHGYCKVLYPNGDYTVLEISKEGGEDTAGNWKMLYGTGQYAGGTGQGAYRVVTSVKSVKVGTYQDCNQSDGTVNLAE